MFDKKWVAKTFDRAAENYDALALLSQQIGQRMLHDLKFMNVQAKLVLDIGAGTGYFSQPLAKLFPQSKILSIDLSIEMLRQREKSDDVSREFVLSADVEELPILDHSVDLIFANFCFEWCHDIKKVFKECQRVLKPSGVLFFSCFGLSTFDDLITRAAASDNSILPIFHDMHDMGDALMAAKLIEPVMRRDDFNVEYSSAKTLSSDLIGLGLASKLTGNTEVRQEVLQGKLEPFFVDEQKKSVHYEVVIGHAWCHIPQVVSEGGEVSIPISEISYTKQ